MRFSEISQKRIMRPRDVVSDRYIWRDMVASTQHAAAVSPTAAPPPGEELACERRLVASRVAAQHMEEFFSSESSARARQAEPSSVRLP